MLTAEQLIAAQKANIDTLLSLTNKALEVVGKLVELNLQVATAAIGDAAETTRSALSIRDAQELVNLQASMLQSAAEKATAYCRHLYEIAASTDAEAVKAAEEQSSAAQRQLLSMVDSALKNAPAGGENGLTLVKSALTAANSAYESVHKAAKQAAEVAEASLQAMTNSALNAAPQAAEKSKRQA